MCVLCLQGGTGGVAGGNMTAAELLAMRNKKVVSSKNGGTGTTGISSSMISKTGSNTIKNSK